MNNAEHITCPLCSSAVDKLLYRFHIDSERKVIGIIKEQHPGWAENDGICSRCVDYYSTQVVMQQRMLPAVGPHFPIKSADDFVIIPTGLRLDADPRFTGKGVTICFIDSGFYPHPDLTQYKNRIKKYIDITNSKATLKIFANEGPESFREEGVWHGTMTSVVCAGDGYSSRGLYKGIASDAELVLIKVMNEEGKIPTGNIVMALQWVKKNHKKYNIRIINMSVGDDEPISYKESEIDKLAEELIAEGITVIAAVGNDEAGAIKPPANGLNVIAVGGVDDNNSLSCPAEKLYHSSYGKTTDALMKPELVAQAIWIAAPILPGTKEQEEAEVLYRLVNAADDELKNEAAKYSAKINWRDGTGGCNEIQVLRENIIQRIQEAKYISSHYMHVDGTSFAAPIVSAVAAQLLEANPGLTPAMIREILFSTAKRIEGSAAERQGFGMIQPRKALLQVLKKETISKPENSPYINAGKKSIEFYFHDDTAAQISLAGSFNGWAEDVLLMEPGRSGLWKIEIPMLAPGRYEYKYFADGNRWMEDRSNPYKEPDGFGGLNSILMIDKN